MQHPAMITFRNMEPSPTVEAHIMRRIGDLEKRFERIVSCHVAIDAPPRRRMSGRDFKVQINVQVPDPDISSTNIVGTGTAADNISLAVHQAFSAAVRRLLRHQKHCRRLHAQRS